MIYKRSSALFNSAKMYLPGGVNSPVRAFKAVGGHPLFIKEAKGAYLYDEDNNTFIDYVNSWGPMVLGHAYPPVIKAITNTAKKGTSFGTPTALETEIAQLAVNMVPNIDKIRFVNSGTEACMSAVRLARGYTEKSKIIKFAGCYHGHSDAFLIQAGSGGATFGIPNSPGVTQETAKNTLLAKFNDIESVTRLVLKHKSDIACIIIEPVAGNMGCVPPSDTFLKALRDLCDAHQILLIFDEVMTGFRIAKGGAQERFNVKADIVCFGKVIGGGMPVGAFASRKEIMDYLAPEGPVYQAGTLSGNPIAMAAGLAMLQSINSDTAIFKRLEDKTAYLHQGLAEVFTKVGVDHQINRLGSMLSVHFTKNKVMDFDSASKSNSETFSKFFHGLLDKGVYLPPSAYETWFICDALSYKDIEQTLNATADVAKTLVS